MIEPARADSRARPRRRVFLAGALSDGEGRDHRTLCFLHDLTRDGAQLELAGLRRVQGHVRVYLAWLDRAVAATVVWQSGQRVGLRFADRLPA